jgi:hypothetical protein
MADRIAKITPADGRTRYRCVVDVGPDPRTGKRRRLTQTHDTRGEALAARTRIRQQVDKGTR